ncbi:MAG TPA: prepilin-type N-terminal cleavage/methylation domain-containing protein [Candidatus Baltobacteraceae bacterium]|nr:prepilin-type N-terminal cleavage/methylation domain-containing protein [Candidatus Baltobacteraceae bacterium]
MRRAESGYTLVEILVAAAIAAFVVWGLVALADRFVANAATLNARLNAQATADRLVERIASDAVSAWTLSAPTPDEIDFFAEDGSHRPFTWAYRYDAATRRVTRSTGEVFDALDGFSARAVDVSDLWNPGAAAYDPLFARSHASSTTGNALVALHLTGSGVDRTEVLASGSSPTTFTVVVRFTPSPAPIATPTPIPLR